MKRQHHHTAIFTLLMACLIGMSLPRRANAQAARESSHRAIRFSTDIRPLLSDRCFHCHGPDEESREAELRLDIAPEAKHIVVPGKPVESELFRRITSNDSDEQMPPPGHGKPLTKSEVSLLREWIQSGGKWSAHWAYEKPTKTEPPNIAVDEPSNWIDQFIAQRLTDESLKLSPEADRVTLLRRVSFDLTGLPPTPEEVDAFVADKSTDAWEKVVDRMLASDEHGERLATYWLDLVRYADTVGYHGDQDHSISPYRDWVIDAFIETWSKARGSIRKSHRVTTGSCRQLTKAAFSRRSTWRSTPPTEFATCRKSGWAARWAAASVTTTSSIRTRSKTSIRWGRSSRTSTKRSISNREAIHCQRNASRNSSC